jgi:hypothetical protein
MSGVRAGEAAARPPAGEDDLERLPRAVITPAGQPPASSRGRPSQLRKGTTMGKPDRGAKEPDRGQAEPEPHAPDTGGQAAGSKDAYAKAQATIRNHPRSS